MTARVYRKVKLGLICDDIHPSAQSSHVLHTFSNSDRGHSQNSSPSRYNSQFPVQVNITKDITVDDGHERSSLPVFLSVSKSGRSGIGSSDKDGESVVHVA